MLSGNFLNIVEEALGEFWYLRDSFFFCLVTEVLCTSTVHAREVARTALRCHCVSRLKRLSSCFVFNITILVSFELCVVYFDLNVAHSELVFGLRAPLSHIQTHFFLSIFEVFQLAIVVVGLTFKLRRVRHFFDEEEKPLNSILLLVK